MGHPQAACHTDRPATHEAVKLATLNVTSLKTNREWVSNLLQTLDVIALQEVRVNKRNVGSFDPWLQRAGLQALWGPMPDGLGPSPTTGGVAFVYRPSTPLTLEAPTCETERLLWATGRYMRAAVHHPGGRVDLLNLYLPSGSTADIEAERVRLLGLVTDLLVQRGASRTVVLGDLNTNAECTQALDDLLLTGTLQDPLGPEPTCFQGRPRKLDHALHTSDLGPFVVDPGILDGPHPHQCVSLAIQGLRKWDRLKVPQLPSRFASTTGDAAPQLASHFEVLSVNSALAQNDAIAAWEAWSKSAESFLGLPSGQRGKPPQWKWRSLCKPKTHLVGDAQVAAERKHRRAQRRLVEAQLKLEHRRPVSSWLGLWQRIQADARCRHVMDIPHSPQPAWMQQQANLLHETIGLIRERAANDRIEAWRRRLQTSWANGGGAVFEWVRGSSPNAIPALETPSGPLTDPEAIVEEVAGAWHKLHDEAASLTWDAYREEYADLLGPPRAPWALPPLSGCDLRRAVMRMKVGTATGPDRWARAELLQLPGLALESLAKVLNLCERLGQLPPNWHHTYVRLIPKPDSLPPLAPLKLRPISVMTLAWRAYASVRTRQHRAWSEQHMHPAVKGGRPGHHAQSVWTAIALDREIARQQNRPWLAVALDSEKFYNRLPRDICFGLLRHLGAHPGFVALLENQYSSLQCTWRVGAGCSLPMPPGRTGLAQGCPAAVMAVNLLQSLRAKALAHHPVNPSIWVDDLLLAGSCPQAVQAALHTSADFDRAIGAKVNTAKSAALQDCGSHPLEYQGHPLPETDHLTYLGHALGGAGKWDSRTRAARYRMKRLAYAPITAQMKARVIEAAVTPLLTWGAAGALPPIPQAQALARTTWEVVWGKKRRRRCAQLLSTLIHKGHVIDPVQSLVYAVLLSFSSATPQLQTLWRTAVLALCEDPPLHCWATNRSKHSWINNPVETLFQTLWFCHNHAAPPEPVWVESTLQELTRGPHSVRELIRASVRRTIIRDDLRPVARDGIDAAWEVAFKKGSFNSGSLERLATIVTGAWLTGQEREPEAPCARCGQQRPAGGRVHLWWECPHFDHVRLPLWQPLPTLLQRTVHDGSSALLKCGVLTCADRRHFEAAADVIARTTLCMMHAIAVATSGSPSGAPTAPVTTSPPVSTPMWLPARPRRSCPRLDHRAGAGFVLHAIGAKRRQPSITPSTPASRAAALSRVKRLRREPGGPNRAPSLTPPPSR